MLYNYAITPDVFDAWTISEKNREGLIAVELLRGMQQNGLLADLHNGQWLSQVLRQQDSGALPAALRDRINSCLTVLQNRHRIVRHPACQPRPETDDFRWLHWALETHRHNPSHPFHGVFATEDYIELSELDDEILVPLPRALDAACWLSRRISVGFAKTEDNLKRHLIPLLHFARKVTLIDPHMTCRKDRFFNTVQHCAALLGRHYGEDKQWRIDIHAGDPDKESEGDHREPYQDRLDKWKRELEPVARQFKKKFRVSLWRNRPGGESFHNRYIITDQFGVDARGPRFSRHAHGGKLLRLGLLGGRRLGTDPSNGV